MLKDDAQHHELAAFRPVDQNTRGANAKIRVALRYDLCNLDIGAAFAKLNVEACVAVEALRERRVITGKLKLMLPLELQRDMVERERRRREQQQGEARQHALRPSDGCA